MTYVDATGARRGHEAGDGRPAHAPGALEMPFDGKRMIYGGFDMISSR